MGEFRVHHARFFEYSPSAIHCLSYDNDHHRIALSRADGSVEIWNIKDCWYQERIFPPQEGCTVEALVWCGQRLFTAGLHGDLHELDISTLQVKSNVPSNNGAIWCLAVNENHTHIAAGTENGCVVLYNITNGDCQYERTFDKQEGRILSLAWHEPEQVIVTGGIDNLRVWSISSGRAIQRLTLGHQERNKETIVWTVAVTNDFTIVSGDSRGKTSFWNGKMGTLKKAIISHKSDVLAVCVSPDGNTVFSAGVDPNLVQFDLVPVNTDDNWNMWVRTNVRTQHTHDVRALVIAGKYVVSAGVDCHMIYNLLGSKNDKNEKNWRRIPPVPQISMVSFARQAELVLLRYADYLELWKLGATNKKSENNSEILPLCRNEIKLLQLTSKGGQPIQTASISNDGRWLAYMDMQNINLFRIVFDETIIPGIKISKVRALPSLIPTHRMSFTHDSSYLISATCHGSIQIIALAEDHIRIEHTILPKKENRELIHLLSVSQSGKYFASADLSNNIYVYNIETAKLVCALPTSTSMPIAITFHPTLEILAVAYSNHKIYEFDISNKEYTEWSRNLNKFLPPHWLKRHSPITQIFYHPEQTHLLFVKDEITFCIIDKSKELQHKPEKEKKVFHMCSKFKYLLHLDAVKDDFLLVVERPPLSITETLPAALKKSKFGT